MQLLDAARDTYRPALVAEVPLELAHDGGRSERRELKTAIGFEALHRLQEPDERDLTEIVEWLAAVGEPAREEVGETHVVLDEVIAKRAVPGAPILDETRFDLRSVGSLGPVARVAVGVRFDRAHWRLANRPVTISDEAPRPRFTATKPTSSPCAWISW